MQAGIFLEAYRKQHGMTVTQLAAFLDYNQGNMSRLLNHQIRELKTSTAFNFAKRLGVSVEVLMGVSEEAGDEGEVVKG